MIPLSASICQACCRGKNWRVGETGRLAAPLGRLEAFDSGKKRGPPVKEGQRADFNDPAQSAEEEVDRLSVHDAVLVGYLLVPRLRHVRIEHDEPAFSDAKTVGRRKHVVFGRIARPRYVEEPLPAKYYTITLGRGSIPDGEVDREGIAGVAATTMKDCAPNTAPSAGPPRAPRTRQAEPPRSMRRAASSRRPSKRSAGIR